MSESPAAAAPESGNISGEPTIPTFEELAADPEIAALLAFDPVPRQRKRREGWTAPLQKRFVAELTKSGSPTLAAEALGKKLFSATRLYKTVGADSFRAAWDGAVALFEERAAAQFHADHAGLAGLKPPMVDRRRTRIAHPSPLPHAGEEDEDEDQASLHARAEEARDSISNKLLNCRRLYLQEISTCPGKRAAFEILTQYPIDWERAARCEAQDDEPWRSPNMREPEMLLTAENGWMGDMVHGPDKKASLRAALDKHYAAEGLPPIEWEAE
jgi:hypothetical protein